ncbi:unnamed protein product [Phytophthora fragariaefolia]|uniref:Unnamed protein product n=1 Tax=Phytophthora fragariaefolia TaxID=1490495 RepID=A0A9W6YCP0_9STRA|nr:unnamed protein product [Phytophthora fragariaefolia]
MWSAYVAKTWGVESKSTKFQVLADSYVGVFPEYKIPASELINYYGGCGLVGFPDSMVAECEAETATVIEMVSSLMKEATSAEWLFIDSIADKTQRKFYELVLLGISGYPFTNLLPVDEFYGNMTEILDAYSGFMNVTRFNIDSDQHVWLTGNDYESAEDLEGQSLGNVLKTWLSIASSSSSSDLPAISSSGSSSSGSWKSSSSSSNSNPTPSSGSASTSKPTVSPSSSSSGIIGSVASSSSNDVQDVTPTETPRSTTTAPAETPAGTTATPTTPTSTSVVSSDSPASTTSSPSTEIPVSTIAAPTSTPGSSTSTPSTASEATEPVISIPTYC